MQLDQQAIDEFKELYFKHFGERISDAQAVEEGIRLIKFVKAVYGDELPPKKIDRTNKQ